MVIQHRLLARDLGHPAGWWQLFTFAWIGSSIATVAGALGTGFESDEAVRQAAYAFRQHERGRRQDSEGT